MRVAFFPYGLTQENPYQKLLKTALEEKGIEVICIPGKKWFPLFQFLQTKADVYHFFWPHDLYVGKNFITRCLKKFMLWVSLPILRSKVVIYSAENIASHSGDGNISKTEIKHIHQIVSRCKAIIYMQSAAPEIFRKYYPNAPEKHAIIPHVHYLSVYPNMITRSAARNQLTIPDSGYVYLIAGRIEPYKGIEQVISTFLSIAENNDRLIIAGKCSSAVFLETLRSVSRNDARVIFSTSYISNNDLQVYYNASDVLILNYRDIPLNPGSIISARGFGIPIITPDVPTMRALQKGDLILFDPDTKNGLQNAMVDSRQVVRTYDKQVIASRLSDNEPERIADQLLAFYSTCI